MLSTERLRVQSSLTWLKGVCMGASPVADGILHNPFSTDGVLKPEVIAILTAAKYYIKAYCCIFPSASLSLCATESGEDGGKYTFWPLIHALGRHGVYAVEEGGHNVNHTTLAQTNPFRESSHLALLDALMKAYVSSVVTIPRVVRAIRQISTLNAAHELPCTVEEALLLWLRKVSEAVTRTQQQHRTVMLQEPDAKQRRRNRIQLLESKEWAVARPRGLVEAVTGGQSLAALLIYYCHQEFGFKDFHFKPTQLTQDEAVQNLTKFATFSHSNLPPHTFHIDPEVLVNKDYVSSLHTNVLALLARLYDWFEPGNVSKVKRVTLNTRGDCNGSTKEVPPSQQEPPSSEVSFVGAGNLSAKTKGICRNERTPLLPLRCRVSGIKSSYSASSLAKQQSREYTSVSHSLSSFSSPALVNKAQTSVTFNPRIVSSNSFTLPHTSTIPVITAGVDNPRIKESIQMRSDAGRDKRGLGEIREGMMEVGAKEGRGSKRCGHEGKESQVELKPTAEANSITSSTLSCPVTVDVSSDKHITVKKMIPPFSSAQPQTSAVMVEGSLLSHSPEVHKSFTLDIQHTIASASKAGLPIIGAQHTHLDTDKRNGVESMGNESGLAVGCEKRMSSEEAEVKAESSVSEKIQAPIHPKYKRVVVFIPENVDEEVLFEKFLVTKVKSANENPQEHVFSRLEDLRVSEREDVKQRKQGWRLKLKERRSMQTSNSGVSEKMSNAVNSAEPTSPHSALTSAPPEPPQQQVVLMSTTSKTHKMITTMPLPNDPLTKLPLTPIPVAPPDSLPLEAINTTPHTVEDATENPWSSRGFAPRKEVLAADLQTRRQQLLKEKLEKRQRNQREQKARAAILRDIRVLTEDKSLDATGPTPFITHTGPNCYVKPSAKSNRRIIRNALCHVCLAGDVNVPAKQRALSELDASTALHFFILFKHVISFTFRALYSYSPEEGKVKKIFGSGPKSVQEHMVDHLYKYNSGSKEFTEIHSHSFSLSVDALTLKQEVWASRKSRPSAP